jgi:hypothetical protein
MNLRIKGWKQRELYRDYRDYFPQLKLEKGYWSFKELSPEEWGTLPVPQNRQDVLSTKGE